MVHRVSPTILLDLVHSNHDTDISQGLVSDLQYNKSADQQHQDIPELNIPEEFRTIAEASQTEEDEVFLHGDNDPLAQHGEPFILWLSHKNTVMLRKVGATFLTDADIKQRRFSSR